APQAERRRWWGARGFGATASLARASGLLLPPDRLKRAEERVRQWNLATWRTRCAVPRGYDAWTCGQPEAPLRHFATSQQPLPTPPERRFPRGENTSQNRDVRSSRRGQVIGGARERAEGAGPGRPP